MENWDLCCLVKDADISNVNNQNKVKNLKKKNSYYENRRKAHKNALSFSSSHLPNLKTQNTTNSFSIPLISSSSFSLSSKTIKNDSKYNLIKFRVTDEGWISPKFLLEESFCKCNTENFYHDVYKFYWDSHSDINCSSSISFKENNFSSSALCDKYSRTCASPVGFHLFSFPSDCGNFATRDKIEDKKKEDFPLPLFNYISLNDASKIIKSNFSHYENFEQISEDYEKTNPAFLSFIDRYFTRYYAIDFIDQKQDFFAFQHINRLLLIGVAKSHKCIQEILNILTSKILTKEMKIKIIQKMKINFNRKIKNNELHGKRKRGALKVEEVDVIAHLVLYINEFAYKSYFLNKNNCVNQAEIEHDSIEQEEKINEDTITEKQYKEIENQKEKDIELIYEIHACVNGDLLEYNEKLEKNPWLILTETENDGWIIMVQVCKQKLDKVPRKHKIITAESYDKLKFEEIKNYSEKVEELHESGFFRSLCE